jgi:hypothetical protein
VALRPVFTFEFAYGLSDDVEKHCAVMRCAPVAQTYFWIARVVSGGLVASCGPPKWKTAAMLKVSPSIKKDRFGSSSILGGSVCCSPVLLLLF